MSSSVCVFVHVCICVYMGYVYVQIQPYVRMYDNCLISSQNGVWIVLSQQENQIVPIHCLKVCM